MMIVVSNNVCRSSSLLSREAIIWKNQLSVSHWKIPNLPIRAQVRIGRKVVSSHMGRWREDEGYVKVEVLNLG